MVRPSCRCGWVVSFSSCVLPICEPGNAALSMSTTQSSSPDDGVRGLKNGRSIRYAVASLSIGATRSVPSLGPVVDIEVQPCQGRKMEHWFLFGVVVSTRTRVRKGGRGGSERGERGEGRGIKHQAAHAAW